MIILLGLLMAKDPSQYPAEVAEFQEKKIEKTRDRPQWPKPTTSLLGAVNDLGRLDRGRSVPALSNVLPRAGWQRTMTPDIAN
ncbi:hypothetical protein [Bradyrhizobium sp. CCBAU 45389]|uniref:hypothetical protein n=1 Tax=Bradyrhizobium sp. CCBAU 45389 TaxID=858429 RepID=UPI002305CA62|nr:hypothetical protein [Bradyrhizobium sp. CCBAU 45389]MDA9399021.1 hypothetical protein [Bradyrhizobium sp. CCBAU 45389]